MLFIIFITLFVLSNGAYLNKLSQHRIKYIIQHPATTPEMREKINYVLFDSYKEWATSKAIHFKRFHKQKCNHIKNDEMASYALFGLYQGIERYNGNDTFITYVESYIKNELQKGMSKLIPINALPKTIFKKKKTTEENNKLYNIYLKPTYIGFDNYLMENTIYNSIYSHKNKWLNDEHELLFKIRIWKKIRELPPFQMRIMYYKYSNDFEMLRSNIVIAEIMDCSIETIRIHLLDIKTKLLPVVHTKIVEYS
jgi:RNA polymerase sigma factor (sigma-70 family)